MKETENVTSVELNIIDAVTGEFFTVEGKNNSVNKYYSIKKITTRINAMSLFDTMEKVCKSSRDINIFNILTDMVDSNNQIRINNIKELAFHIGVSRVTLTKFLKLLVDNNFTIKLDRGIYMVNPYIFIGRRVRSNEKRELSQREWDKLNKQREQNE